MQQLNEIDRSRRLQALSVVLAQPHRLGDTRQECASALGRLWISIGTTDKTLLYAGDRYAAKVRRWRRVWGIRTENEPKEVTEARDELNHGTVTKWRAEIDRIDEALNRTSWRVYHATTRLVLDDLDQAGSARLDALVGLRVIAIAMGMAKPDHPFK